MSASHTTIADQSLDLLDGIYGLIDVAFAHDLAVSLADVGTHDVAMSLTASLTTLLTGIDDELPRVAGLGQLGALLGTSEPFVNALYEVLLESGHHLSVRAVLAVLRTRRPIQLAYAHLGTAARMGARQPLTPELQAALQMAARALLANLSSFAELLVALEPLSHDVELAPPPILERR